MNLPTCYANDKCGYCIDNQCTNNENIDKIHCKYSCNTRNLRHTLGTVAKIKFGSIDDKCLEKLAQKIDVSFIELDNLLHKTYRINEENFEKICAYLNPSNELKKDWYNSYVWEEAFNNIPEYEKIYKRITSIENEIKEFLLYVCGDHPYDKYWKIYVSKKIEELKKQKRNLYFDFDTAIPKTNTEEYEKNKERISFLYEELLQRSKNMNCWLQAANIIINI